MESFNVVHRASTCSSVKEFSLLAFALAWRCQKQSGQKTRGQKTRGQKTRGQKTKKVSGRRCRMWGWMVVVVVVVVVVPWMSIMFMPCPPLVIAVTVCKMSTFQENRWLWMILRAAFLNLDIRLPFPFPAALSSLTKSIPRIKITTNESKEYM